MKNVLLAILAVFAYTGSAQAGIPYTCDMKFTMDVEQEFPSLVPTGEGQGKLSCRKFSHDGEVIEKWTSPVSIRMEGFGIGFDFGSAYTVSGVSGALNLSDARHLEGKYHAVVLQAGVVSASLGLTGVRSGVRLQFALSANQQGGGLFLGGQKWYIRLARDAQGNVVKQLTE